MFKVSSEFRRLSGNAGWNLIANALPLVVAVAAVPFLIERMGTERFGLLSLVWVLIGYFSLFDLGLGRALTKWVAEYLGGAREDELSPLCSTGIVLVALIGLIGALVVGLAAILTPTWSTWVPMDLRQEVQSSMWLIALATPLTVLTSAYRGILEGFQKFKLLSMVRAPSGMALFAAPCLSAAFTPRLDAAVASLVVARVFILVAHSMPCKKLASISASAVEMHLILPLLQFGGWLTVSNIVGPVIVYIDRFVVGALMSVAAVAYYSAPFEIVSRLLIIPAALTAALFPALSHGRAREGTTKHLQRGALRMTLIVVVPLALVGMLFSEWLLRHWLGDEFATRSTLAMQIMLFGFVLNAAAHVPFIILHSRGRTRATALLHLVELPFYIVVLYAMVQRWGLEGAAAAWSLRAGFDLAAMVWMARRIDNTDLANGQSILQ